MYKNYKVFVQPQDVCDLLNELLKLDYDCIENLIDNGVLCNNKIANHPTVQVKDIEVYDKQTISTLGIIGVINGLFGVDDNNTGAICYEIDDKTGMITCFKLTENYKKWLKD